MSDDAFIRAIQKKPNDNSLRLIYADWLEEQGDPRAELIRLECKLAGADPQEHADLRARREELRGQVDRAWAVDVALPRITVIEDLIHYLKHYHRSLSASPGLDPRSVPSDLPRGLSLLYRELGGLFDVATYEDYCPFANQDGLYAPHEVGRRETGGMIEFAFENQGNWACRFPLGEDDPPVYSNAADVWQYERRGYQIVCDSLNHFLITLCLQEAVMSSPVLIALDGSFAEVSGRTTRPLWLQGQYVDDEPSHDFYDAPGHDVLIMDSAIGLWLGTHAESSLQWLGKDVAYTRVH